MILWFCTSTVSVLNASVSGEMIELTLNSLSSHTESSSLVFSGLSLLWESCRSGEAIQCPLVTYIMIIND